MIWGYPILLGFFVYGISNKTWPKHDPQLMGSVILVAQDLLVVFSWGFKFELFWGLDVKPRGK